jgi:hypothetical protein
MHVNYPRPVSGPFCWDINFGLLETYDNPNDTDVRGTRMDWRYAQEPAPFAGESPLQNMRMFTTFIAMHTP